MTPEELATATVVLLACGWIPIEQGSLHFDGGYFICLSPGRKAKGRERQEWVRVAGPISSILAYKFAPELSPSEDDDDS